LSVDEMEGISSLQKIVLLLTFKLSCNSRTYINEFHPYWQPTKVLQSSLLSGVFFAVQLGDKFHNGLFTLPQCVACKIHYFFALSISENGISVGLIEWTNHVNFFQRKFCSE
jgi:hypothetical protein